MKSATFARFYFAAALGCWVSFTLWGCGSQEAYKPHGYKGKVRVGELAAWKQGILPDGKLHSSFEVFAKGVERRQVGNRQMRTVRVGMNVNNNTGAALEVDSQEAYLVDHKGEVLRCTGMRVSGAKKLYTKLKPNEHALLDLYFDLGDQTRNLNSFSVHWRYQVGGQPYSQASVFDRVDTGWTAD